MSAPWSCWFSLCICKLGKLLDHQKWHPTTLCKNSLLLVGTGLLPWAITFKTKFKRWIIIPPPHFVTKEVTIFHGIFKVWAHNRCGRVGGGRCTFLQYSFSIENIYSYCYIYQSKDVKEISIFDLPIYNKFSELNKWFNFLTWMIMMVYGGNNFSI